MFTPDNPIDLSSTNLLRLFRKHNIESSAIEKIGRNTYSVHSSTNRFVLKTSLEIYQQRSIVYALTHASSLYQDVFEVPVVVDLVECPPTNCLLLLSYVSGRPLRTEDYSFVFQILTNGHPFCSSHLPSPPNLAPELNTINHFFTSMSAQIVDMIENKPIYTPLLGFFAAGPPDKSPVLIHGDFIFQNMLCLSTSPSRLGLIDWEFGGFFYKSFDYSWFLVMSCVYELCDVTDLPSFSDLCSNQRYFLLFSHLRLLLRLSQVRNRSEVHVLQELRFTRMLSMFLDLYDLPSLAGV